MPEQKDAGAQPKLARVIRRSGGVAIVIAQRILNVGLIIPRRYLDRFPTPFS